MKTISQPDFFETTPEARGIVGKVIDRIKAMGKKKQPVKVEKKRKGQPAPMWREFFEQSFRRISKRSDSPWKIEMQGGIAVVDYTKQLAADIVAHGDGEAFLKAVRRGRSTQRQNLRYQLLREVERLMGDAVPRRRPDANTPDAIALKKNVRLELEAYAEAGKRQA